MTLKTEFIIENRMVKDQVEKEVEMYLKNQKDDTKKSSYLILQAHLWQHIETKHSGNSNIIMLGSLYDFYNWFDVHLHSSFTSAFVSYQDENDCLFRGIKHLDNKKPYIGYSIKKFLKMSRLDRQIQLLKIPLNKSLTKSELEILVLINEGHTTKEIAQFRTRSVHTVKTQKKSIREKINTDFTKLPTFAGRRWKAIKTLCDLEKRPNVIDNILQNTT